MQTAHVGFWLALLLAGHACAQTDPPKQIFQPPPLQWDNAMLTARPALQQTATDLVRLTGGVAFGMSPAEVNAHLPDPYPGVAWSALPEANEFPGDVRYFWVRIDSVGDLRAGVTACAGGSSYLVFLFSSRGLFRVSYRLLPDKTCPDTSAAARQVFARYVPIGSTVALSARYRTGSAQVVDVTDPTASFLIPIRWSQGSN